MPILYVNTGSSANKGDGDSLRVAFGKINYNFSQLAAATGGSSATITVNSFPPPNPTEGALWYDTVSGRSFIYYDNFWVDAAPPAVEPLEDVTTNIIPSLNLVYNIGSTSKQWNNLYVNNIRNSNTSSIWTFNTNSSITLPHGHSILSTATALTISTITTSNFIIQSGDKIILQGNNKTDQQRANGGDINLIGGLGGDANFGGSGGNGGDLTLTGGAGGNSTSATIGGAGGSIIVNAGIGGAGAAGISASNGGNIVLTAGNAGSIAGGALFGAAGGNVEITAGTSNGNFFPGGNIILTAGQSVSDHPAAGHVDIVIPATTASVGGTWRFAGNGKNLQIPDDSRIYGQGVTIESFHDDLVLRSVSTGDIDNDYIFSTTGTIHLPGDSRIITDGPNVILVSGNGGWASLESYNAENYIWVDDTAAYISLDWPSPGRTWTFDPAGGLTLPCQQIDNGLVHALDFYADDPHNHVFVLDTDWTLRLKVRAQGANQGRLQFVVGQNTKINVNGTGSNIEFVTGDGSNTSTWLLDLNGTLTTPGHIIPNANNSYDLGSTSSQWRSLYVSTNTIYIGGIPITVNPTNNTLLVGVQPGQESTSATNVATESFVINYVNENAGGGGLSPITIPASTGTTYKGLQVSYGLIHSNSSPSELNLSKIVIHKPAITSIEMDLTTEQDDFKVSGLGSSDVLAMFVLYGNTNGPKALSTLTTFAEVIIDNVILDGGEEGSFNTVDEMKSAFYSNFSTISAAAGGLDADFEFYNNPTNVNTGTTTVQEGSGAAFSIVSPGDGFSYVDPPTVWLGSEGTNYLVGHKIKILGTDLGGITPDNDAIITITGVGAGGSITTATIAGTGGDVGGGTYNAVTGTNYQVGSGLDVANIYFTNLGAFDYLSLNSQGTNYVVGDILTLLGSGIVNGSSPTNDITITITSVDGSGMATGWTASGIFPRQWPTNSISDGGNDQYDGANRINSSFASQINYNQGNTVVDGIAAFGTGSSYTFVYNTGTFGLFVTGNASTYIETSGNSGADGNSTAESGNLYGPNTAAETFDNAVTHLNIVGDPYAGPIVSFTRPDNSDETIDILIPDDGEGAGVAIARDSNGNGIFNPYREGSWDSDVSPGGTLWNIDGWTDLSDVESRTYTPLYEAFGFGGLGNKIVGTECVMYLPDNGKYYAVKFNSWTQGGNGGGFAYTRRELDLAKLQEGIRFSDGTRLKSAQGVGRVKLQSPGNRRIEEVYGYKTVSLSQVVTSNLTTPASRSGSNTNTIWIDSTATTVDNIISNPANYNNAYDFEFSLDNNIWYEWTNSTSFSGNERGYSIATTVTYLQGDTIYFRYKTGGEPVVWWDKADLPGGSSNFRGAVIDYHAWTGESTIIGTIHIVDDDGEEHISHQEVQSGSTDGENDDLWLVTQEGQIKYRRIDGEGRTLKVQWSAKVFYGSEYYND